MGVYRMNVGLKYPGGGRTGVNVWHIRADGGLSGNLSTATGIVKAFYTALQIRYTASYFFTWDGVLTEVLTDTPAPVPQQTTFSIQGSGGGVDDTGPAGVGLCISWKTTLATRSGRGRTFLAPLRTSQYGPDGTIEDAHLAAVRAAATTLVGSSTADLNGAVCIVGLKNKGRPEDGYLARDIVASTINDKVAYLSSRRD